MHRFGEVGVALSKAGESEAVLGLQRLYWFRQFGFVKERVDSSCWVRIMSVLVKPTTHGT